MGKKRSIKMIVIHQTGSSLAAHDNIETIREWHTMRGFVGADGVTGTHDDVGYHYVILKNGAVKRGRDEDTVGAHTKGYNTPSLGVCLCGLGGAKNKEGKEIEHPTEAQKKALEILLIDICSRHDLEKKDILPHSDLGKTECPGFDLHAWLSGLGWQ